MSPRVVEAKAPLLTAPAALKDPVIAQVRAIVAGKTGYPEDMLDLDLDLEADLGVDTVKQAETMAAIRETFGIPRQENLKLRDYPTLAHVIGFVHDMRPDLAAPAPAVPAMPTAPLRRPRRPRPLLRQPARLSGASVL